MKTALEIEAILAQCTSSEGYHYNAIVRKAGIVYTEGIRMLVIECQAWWLMDAIATHQPTAMKDGMLKDMQFWTLTVKNGSADLICERDAGDIAIRQEIPYTDFPLDSIKVWLERGMAMIDGEERMVMVAMLPSER